MPIFIAMLRGINVSGHNCVKMEDLRTSFTTLGFARVETYVQSGNVVFMSASKSAANLTKSIEQRMAYDFGFSVPVYLRTADDMAAIVAGNPLLKETGIDPTKLHVTFLSAAPARTAHEQIAPLAAGTEKFYLVGREIYLYCPEGYGRTKLSNTALEKKLSVGATTRNWKTVNTLLAMTQ